MAAISSGAGGFSTEPVPWLKEYLKERGIQSSRKRKVELVELCVKSEEMKVPKISEEEAPVDPAISMKEQLKTTDEGHLANPLNKKIRLFVNGPTIFQTYQTLDFLIFLIILWERIPAITPKA